MLDDFEASPEVLMTAERFSTRYARVVDVDGEIDSTASEKLSSLF
jgi:hypothetical protein